MPGKATASPLFTDRRAGTLRSKRTRQPWPTGKPFKILSMDGGGIKGIYTAELLRLCEAEFCVDTQIRDHFDLIAGTSTGGIIAIGLGLGMPAEALASFYIEDGRRIFPKRNWLQKGLRAFAPLYSYKELERSLKERFGEREFGESHARLLVPAFMVPKTEIAVFKTDHHPDYRRDHAAKAWRVARATSAAPTYLRGHEDRASGKLFIDGGIWANNPVMLAIIEALTAYEVTLDQIEVLSIGTGNAPFVVSPMAATAGLFAWREVIKGAMFLTTDNATAQAALLLGPESHLRIAPSSELASIELGDYDRATSLLPRAAHEAFRDNHDQLQRCFASRTTARERHYAGRQVPGTPAFDTKLCNITIGKFPPQ